MTDLAIEFTRDDRGRPAAAPRPGAGDPQAARLLAEFLTVEVGRTTQGVDHVVARVDAAVAQAAPWEGSGNALAFDIGADGIRLSDLWREPPCERTIPLDALRAALAAWRAFIAEAGGRD